jgi:hypothetical protein
MIENFIDDVVSFANCNLFFIKPSNNLEEIYKKKVPNFKRTKFEVVQRIQNAN